MLFSILIANYNNGKYFKDCYDSLIAQTYKNWEVVVVDDGSTDDSVAVVKEIIGDDPRFRFYENDRNHGCGYTKNRCAALAKGDVCGFVDPDDSITPEAIEVMIEAHKKRPDIALIYSNMYFCDEFLNITGTNPWAKETIIDQYFTNLDYAVNHFVTFKRMFYMKTEGISERFKRAVDQDLYLKLSEVGDFLFLNKFLYHYRFHKGGIATSSGRQAFYNHLKVVAKSEERRGINLEDVVAPYLKFHKDIEADFSKKLQNERFLLSSLWKLFKKHPFRFFKRIF